MDFEPDPVNYENNDAAFVASAQTDKSGTYSIGSIGPGNYGVVPIPPNNSLYRFDLDDPSDPYNFAITDTQRAYRVNFTSPDPSIFDEGQFTVTFVHKNVQCSSDKDKLWIKISRMCISAFVIAYYLENRLTDQLAIPPILDSTFTSFYGYTAIVQTITNHFMFECRQITNKGGWDSPNVVVSFAFDYDFTLSNCPSRSLFELDWTAKTARRIE